MNIFIVRLALSYINAIEAQHYYNILPENSILVLLYQDSSSVDLKHIEKIIDTSGWREIHYLPYNFISYKYFHKEIDDNLGWYEIIKKYGYLKRFVAHFNDTLRFERFTVDKVFLSNENTASMRHLANMVRPSQIIHLDEGFKTYTLIKEKLERGRLATTLYYLKGWFKGLLSYGLARYKDWPLENVTYFTSYGSEQSTSSQVVLNTYDRIRSQIKKKSRSNQVLFLGQSLSELSFVSEEKYLKLIEIIKKHYAPLELVYQAHRDEHVEKIAKIERQFDIKVRHATMPIEHKLVFEDYAPKIVASFFSSALQNVSHLFGDLILVHSIYLEKSIFTDLSESKIDEIQGFYTFLKEKCKSKISVIELSE